MLTKKNYSQNEKVQRDLDETLAAAVEQHKLLSDVLNLAQDNDFHAVRVFHGGYCAVAGIELEGFSRVKVQEALAKIKPEPLVALETDGLALAVKPRSMLRNTDQGDVYEVMPFHLKTVPGGQFVLRWWHRMPQGLVEVTLHPDWDDLSKYLRDCRSLSIQKPGIHAWIADRVDDSPYQSPVDVLVSDWLVYVKDLALPNPVPAFHQILAELQDLNKMDIAAADLDKKASEISLRTSSWMPAVPNTQQSSVERNLRELRANFPDAVRACKTSVELAKDTLIRVVKRYGILQNTMVNRLLLNDVLEKLTGIRASGGLDWKKTSTGYQCTMTIGRGFSNPQISFHLAPLDHHQVWQHDFIRLIEPEFKARG